MAPIYRRGKRDGKALAALAAVLLAGCALPGAEEASKAHPAPPALAQAVRPEAVGQQWVYQVRNVYNHEIVDQVTETVASVGPTIHIERMSQKFGRLADEVHSKWGLLTEDSHWERPVLFRQPLPAWPRNFETGHCETFHDEYRFAEDSGGRMFWNLTMTPVGWESIHVPAGQFEAIHFRDHIHYLSDDWMRVDSDRDESVWLAPQIGRWVQRRSRGSYYYPDRGGGMVDDYRQWELVSWR